MNLTNLILWAMGAVSTLTAVYRLDEIHHAILKAQASLIYEARTETWGTPKVLETPRESLGTRRPRR